jgi:hypothetical protein
MDARRRRAGQVQRKPSHIEQLLSRLGRSAGS